MHHANRVLCLGVVKASPRIHCIRNAQGERARTTYGIVDKHGGILTKMHGYICARQQ